MGVSENRLNPIVPNGFADHEIPMKNGYFIGNIPNIFRHTHIPKTSPKHHFDTCCTDVEMLMERCKQEAIETNASVCNLPHFNANRQKSPVQIPVPKIGPVLVSDVQWIGFVGKIYRKP